MSSPLLSERARAPRLQVIDAVESCLISGEYSDLTIQCGDDVYKVHKVVVCTRAGFFARAIKFGGKEALENVINLPEDEPRAIACLMRYLYSGTYNDDHLGNLVLKLAALHDASNSHSEVYEIAEKYEVTGLKELACKNFTLACETFWDDEAFPIAIKHALSTTIAEDRGLRDVIIKTISSHDSFVRKAEIQAVMLEHSDLAVGVLLKKAG
ncbi:unnamed protein product [Alternaria alternata]